MSPPNNHNLGQLPHASSSGMGAASAPLISVTRLTVRISALQSEVTALHGDKEALKAELAKAKQVG
mgnify:CR=1 FL=1